MANTSGDTLTELERQAEARRAELAHTVDELHERVSPRAIKADAHSYARERMEAIQQRALENPLQAAAIAVGLAYPLWRIIGSIPAPLLMIGAGLALSGRGSGGSTFARSHEGHDGIGQAVSGLSSKAGETVDKVRTMASETVASAAETLSGTYEAGREAAAGAAGELEKTYSRSRDNVIDLFERHPVVAGGIAFAVGSLVASSLPVTRQENRLMGEHSDELKHRTRDMASEGLSQASNAARHIYEEASSQVREEGLTPDAARNTVQAAAETVRETVQQAMKDGEGVPRTSRSSRQPRNS